MRHIVVPGFVLLATGLAFGPAAWGQKPGLEVPLITPGPGWKPCPRCENEAHVAEDRRKANVDTRPFDRHDLSGVWGDNGVPQDPKTRPAFTPYGEKLYEEMKKKVTPKGVDDALNDPIGICDPIGYPRAFGYNYGFEFIQVPNRVFQFFEWSHTWRTIWTDGRKLRQIRRLIDSWVTLLAGGREIHSLSSRMATMTELFLAATPLIPSFRILPKCAWWNITSGPTMGCSSFL